VCLVEKRIVIIGGGVIGCSVAWHLAEAGLGEVIVIERDRLGSGTTWHSAGNITWRPGAQHDEMVLYALAVIERITRETGQETGWVKTGRLFLAHGSVALDRLQRYQDQAEQREIRSHILTAREAALLHPLLDANAISGAWFNPLSGRVNPADLTAAYAKGARRHGAKIIEDCKVSVILERNGRVAGVETTNGAIDGDVIVVAAGLWSRGLVRPIGIHLPQWHCEHFYVIADVTPRLAREVPSFVVPEDLLYGREEVGGMMVGFFDENAKIIEDGALPEPFAFTLLPPDWDKIAPYFEQAARIFPVLETAPIRRFVNGPESFTPDDLPLIGSVSGLDGLYLCTAMNSGGVTYSAGAGHIIAALIAGCEPRFPCGPFAPGRFGDKARDLDWIKQEVSAVVSRGYQQTNL
jgi:4-methylaminobutanoate oxidase (formaldehyde-forming)